MKFAGFWIRSGAFLLDLIILVIIDVLVEFFLLGIGTMYVRAFYWMYVLTVILEIGINVLYLTWFHVTYGQTPGKMMFRIRVIQMDGYPNGWKTVILREIFGRIVSMIVFCLGYIWVAFDFRKQGWHDKIAGTYVIKV
jgi:uncharacterized RDD family membrane protein YckC